MPQKPRRPCRYPGCPELCEQGQVFCKDHIMWSGDRLRGGAAARGYDTKWREARALFLKQHPLCVFCQAEGKVSGIRRTGNPYARAAMTRKQDPDYEEVQHEEPIHRIVPCTGQTPG